MTKFKLRVQQFEDEKLMEDKNYLAKGKNNLIIYNEKKHQAIELKIADDQIEVRKRGVINMNVTHDGHSNQQFEIIVQEGSNSFKYETNILNVKYDIIKVDGNIEIITVYQREDEIKVKIKYIMEENCLFLNSKNN